MGIVVVVINDGCWQSTVVNKRSAPSHLSNIRTLLAMTIWTHLIASCTLINVISNAMDSNVQISILGLILYTMLYRSRQYDVAHVTHVNVLKIWNRFILEINRPRKIYEYSLHSSWMAVTRWAQFTGPCGAWPSNWYSKLSGASHLSRNK